MRVVVRTRSTTTIRLFIVLVLVFDSCQGSVLSRDRSTRHERVRTPQRLSPRRTSTSTFVSSLRSNCAIDRAHSSRARSLALFYRQRSTLSCSQIVSRCRDYALCRFGNVVSTCHFVHESHGSIHASPVSQLIKKICTNYV